MGSLKKSYEFKSVFKNGKCYFTKSLSIYYKLNTDNKWKLGLAVSKKIGKAVIRNKVKRLLREIFTKFIKEYINQESIYFYIVLVAKPTIVNCSFNDINVEIKSFFNKIFHINHN